MALAAPTVMMTLKTVSARLPRASLINGRNDQEDHELLRIDEARSRIRRKRGGHERPGRIDQKGPEEARGIPAFLAHEQRAGPARQHQCETDARCGDRQL